MKCPTCEVVDLSMSEHQTPPYVSDDRRADAPTERFSSEHSPKREVQSSKQYDERRRDDGDDDYQRYPQRGKKESFFGNLFDFD